MLQRILIASALVSSVAASTWADDQTQKIETMERVGREAAIKKTADDKNLKWGPAPEFMPQGTQLAVLHGDPTKNDADVFLKIPAKAAVPNHFHTSSERMMLVSGELQVSIEGQQPITLKPGSYAYMPAKRPHEGLCVSDADCVLFIAFKEPVDAVPVPKAPGIGR